jgi:hypothetical protein
MPGEGAVSGAEVKVGGTKLDERIGQKLVEARIAMNLRLPDACLLKFTDPGLETIDSFPIKIGSDIEVSLSAPNATSASSRASSSRPSPSSTRGRRSPSAPTTARTR